MEFGNQEQNYRVSNKEATLNKWHEISQLVMKNDVSDKKETIIYHLKRNQKLILKT